jgi:DNA repair protein RadC
MRSPPLARPDLLPVRGEPPGAPGAALARAAARPPEFDPGERLERRGPDALADAELLQVLLGGGRRLTAVERRALHLLARFGDLRGLAGAATGQLTAWEGLPPRQARRLVAAFALGRRAAAVPLRRGQALRGAGDIHAAYGPLLRDLPKEVLLAVHLDAKGRVLRELRVSEGTLTQSPAHPREVFGPALREGAAALVLVHNHPSGDPEPSTLDEEVTRRLVAAGDVLGIALLDHLVLGDGCYVSLAERGVVPRGA